MFTGAIFLHFNAFIQFDIIKLIVRGLEFDWLNSVLVVSIIKLTKLNMKYMCNISQQKEQLELFYLYATLPPSSLKINGEDLPCWVTWS